MYTESFEHAEEILNKLKDLMKEIAKLEELIVLYQAKEDLQKSHDESKEQQNMPEFLIDIRNSILYVAS